METKTAAMSDATVRQMISLLKDPVFLRPARVGGRASADARRVRNACYAGGRLARAGVGHPQRAAAPDGRRTAVSRWEGRRSWYYPTRSIVANLDDIDKRCHAGSWLDLAVRSRNATYFLVEAHGRGRCDAERGRFVHRLREGARAAFRARPGNLGRAPPLNWHRTAWHLEELAGRPCTPEIVLEVYERVSRGVERQVTRSSRQGSRCGSAPLDRSAALALVSKIIEENSETYAEHPLLLALGARHLFASVHPLPD
ncbi:MAG: hypothetical protein ACLSVD_01250 [Eggerthellaceae bacterium]